MKEELPLALCPQGIQQFARQGGTMKGWVVVSCFPVCATTQPFLLPCSANCCVPEQRAPHHGGVFDSLSFQSKTLKFARFGNWGGGVYGGPIFDKNFAIHAKLKLGSS